MLNKFKKIASNKVLSNTAIYASGSMLNKMVPFFLMPVLTRYLTPEDYGRVATYNVIFLIVGLFIELGLTNSVSVNYYKLNKNEFKKYLGNVILIQAAAVIFLMTVFGIWGNRFEGVFQFPSKWFIPLSIAAGMRCVNQLNLTYWQMSKKPISYGLCQFLMTLFEMTFSLLLIIKFSMGWEGRVLGSVVAAALFGLISLIYFKITNSVVYTISKEISKDAILIGFPLLPHALGYWGMSQIDRVLINKYVGFNSTGIYSVGYQIASMVSFVTTSFNLAWSPYLFEKLSSQASNMKSKLVKLTYLYFILLILIWVLMNVCAPVLFYLFVGPKFKSAIQFLPLISANFIFMGMYYMVTNYIMYAKKSYFLAIITLVCGGINFLLNMILIKKIGCMGAALSGAITALVYFLATWLLSSVIYPMPWFRKNLDAKTSEASSNLVYSVEKNNIIR